MNTKRPKRETNPIILEIEAFLKKLLTAVGHAGIKNDSFLRGLRRGAKLGYFHGKIITYDPEGWVQKHTQNYRDGFAVGYHFAWGAASVYGNNWPLKSRTLRKA